MSTLNTFLASTSTVSPIVEETSNFMNVIKVVEQDKIFISIIGLIVFLMGRSLYNEMHETCARMEILDSKYIKKLTLWSVLFLYSRSIIHSSVLALLIIFLFPDIFLTDKTDCVNPKNI